LEIVRPIGKNYPLPPNFAPSALDLLVSYPFIRVQPGKEAMVGHPEALAWLDKLFETAGRMGISNLYVSSAYRSTAQQTTMWQAAGGWNQTRVAPPGTSEHQSGLAFDLSASPVAQNGYGQSGFVATSAAGWLRANAQRFGFVNTYPRPGIDGIEAEHWHWRYVGVGVATRLYELGYLDPGSTINPIEFYAELTR
jgi:D-alanyl-D-alanine carboxypeptidase